MNENHRSGRLHTRLWASAALTLALAACAGTPPPRERMSLANAAVDGAISAGASELAQPDLMLARNKLEAARVAVAKGDNAKAQVMAEQAEVDGLVARNKAAQERAQRALVEVQQGLHNLRQQGTSRP